MAFSKLVTLSQQPPFTPPSMDVYQASYGGLVFGGLTQGATYQFVAIPVGSIDMPNVQTSDAQRTLDQGEFEGVDVSAGRDHAFQQVITGVTATAMEEARQALGGVMAVAGTTELPFYMQLNSGLFACMSRPRKHAYKVDINSVLPFGDPGNMGGDTALSTLHATDPRWYAMPVRVAGPVGLPQPEGGLGFNATPNFSFGGGSAGGYLAAYNNGQFEMRPVLVITGPCTNPMVTNQSLANDPSIGFNITLNTGDTLTIDTGAPTALYLPSGGSVPASVLRAGMDSNRWWNLAPANGPEGIGGPNNLVFTSSDGTQVAGTLTVYSADAYMAL
jgi:hypothetical protein